MSAENTGRRVVAILVAGGQGVRFGRAEGKQTALVLGEPLLTHTARAVGSASRVDLIVLVCPGRRRNDYEEAALRGVGSTPLVSVASGATRQDSVHAGLAKVDNEDVVVIHDAARALVTPQTVDFAVERLLENDDLDGVVVGHPAYDTLKLVEAEIVADTPDRSRYWVAQTPQVFHAKTLKAAYARAAEEGSTATDDSSLVERSGGRVAVVEGPRDNIKVTVAQDLALVECVLLSRRTGR